MKGKTIRRGQRPKNRSPIWIMIGGLAFIAIAIGFTFRPGPNPVALPTPEVTGAPRLKISPEQVDLGSVLLGREVQVDIQLRNVGDQPLRLAKEPWIEVVEGC